MRLLSTIIASRCDRGQRPAWASWLDRPPAGVARSLSLIRLELRQALSLHSIARRPLNHPDKPDKPGGESWPPVIRPIVRPLFFAHPARGKTLRVVAHIRRPRDQDMRRSMPCTTNRP